MPNRRAAVSDQHVRVGLVVAARAAAEARDVSELRGTASVPVDTAAEAQGGAGRGAASADVAVVAEALDRVAGGRIPAVRPVGGETRGGRRYHPTAEPGRQGVAAGPGTPGAGVPGDRLVPGRRCAAVAPESAGGGEAVADSGSREGVTFHLAAGTARNVQHRPAVVGTDRCRCWWWWWSRDFARGGCVSVAPCDLVLGSTQEPRVPAGVGAVRWWAASVVPDPCLQDGGQLATGERAAAVDDGLHEQARETLRLQLHTARPFIADRRVRTRGPAFAPSLLQCP